MFQIFFGLNSCVLMPGIFGLPRVTLFYLFYGYCSDGQNKGNFTYLMNKVVAVLKDVLFVDSGDPWNPNPANVSKVMKMLEGIHKVLKQDGVYISISFGQVKLALIFFFSSFL